MINMAGAVDMLERAFHTELNEGNIHDVGKDALKTIRPKWERSSIKTKTLSGGITNRLEAFYHQDDKFGEDTIVLRIYGQKTDLIIDRDAEKINMKMLSKAGLCPPLYATFPNGIMYGFASGVTLNEDSCREPKISCLVAQELVRLQMSKSTDPTTKSDWSTKLDNWFKVLPEKFDDPIKQEKFLKNIKSRGELEKEKRDLEQHLSAMDCPIVFAHNDLLLENIIYSDEQAKVTFIDHEYGMFNYQVYDIGNHFCEYAGVSTVDYSRYPDKDYQLNWLRSYKEAWNESHNITAPITQDDLEKLYVQTNKCAMAAHYFWGIWALIQARYSLIDFDYLEYGIIRFGEYFRRKDEFLGLQSP